ncbi:glycoside hydrolase family 18 chitinase [Streptomyces calidiresistens]|uniref:glycosyl hydrolase family 18 protein n=1 Tax=Streptomyces calidiresistens TaxID=1485586 RepID=UPI003F68F40E
MRTRTSARNGTTRRNPLTRRLVALLTALAVPLGLMVAMAAPAQAAGASAAFTKTSEWDTGFGGQWTVTNTGTSSLNGWTLSWSFPSGTTVGSLWNGVLTRSGNTYTVTNESWNGTLAPGQSTTVGFSGTGNGNPTDCRINGASCDGGNGGQPGAPGAPGALVPGTVTDTSIAISWAPASGDVTEYEVLRNGSVVATTTARNHTSTGLSANTSYTFTVRAKGPGGTGPASEPLTVRTTGGQQPDPVGDLVNVGYFTEWGVYGRNYHVKNIVSSGSASKLTHINYAFGNVQNGRCTIGDSYAAYDRAYTAAESVDGVADTWDQPLRGNFNQLKKLKEMHPHIKVVWSFGGWTWSGGFGQAMQNPQAFAKSCYDLVNDPRWEGVFDGIDLDWEYPNACGLTCDNSGRDSFRRMMEAFRAEFGDQLVTAAITADASSGGKIDAADYAGGSRYADYLHVMTYDFFGAWAAQGPTAPHSPLNAYQGIPQAGFNSHEAIQKLKAQGVPAKKLTLGIGFYGRGWTGVTQSAPGGSATGPAPGTYEQGIEDYKVLKQTCPATGTIAGTAYAHCGNNWWSYDTPQTIAGKMRYAKEQGLGGAMFWELSGDTSNGELITAIGNGLR